MSSASTHAFVAAFAIGGAHTAHDLHERGEITPLPIASAVVAAALGSLPDWIEPATNPHHRQFFHSVLFLGGVCYGTYRAYHWQPQTPWQSVLRWLTLIAGGAYIAHLICDAQTARSLPVLGRL